MYLIKSIFVLLTAFMGVMYTPAVATDLFARDHEENRRIKLKQKAYPQKIQGAIVHENRDGDTDEAKKLKSLYLSEEAENRLSQRQGWLFAYYGSMWQLSKECIEYLVLEAKLEVPAKRWPRSKVDLKFFKDKGIKVPPLPKTKTHVSKAVKVPSRPQVDQQISWESIVDLCCQAEWQRFDQEQKGSRWIIPKFKTVYDLKGEAYVLLGDEPLNPSF